MCWTVQPKTSMWPAGGMIEKILTIVCLFLKLTNDKIFYSQLVSVDPNPPSPLSVLSRVFIS